MATLAKLVVKLITDVNEFTKGMDTAVNKYAKTGKDMADIGDRMTRSVTLPLVALGTASLKLASDLNETRNKAKVVFGSMSDDILAWGKTSLDTVFLSEQHALDYASTFGAIVKNMGLSEKEALDMSKSLVQATVDLASMSNLSYGESFEKIRAGIVGSSEPLLALGKDLRVANVEAYAFTNGIAKIGDVLDNRQLTLARFGSLMSQMKDETGDAARTIGDLAGQTRLLSETFQSTLATFGEKLIPVAIKFMEVAIPILEWLGKMPDGLQTNIVLFLSLATVLGPLLSGVGRLLQLGLAYKTAFGAAGAAGALSATKTAATAATVATTGLGMSLGVMLASIVSLSIAIVGLIYTIKFLGPAAWENFKMLESLRVEFVKATQDWVARLVNSMVDGIVKGVKAIRSRISDFVNSGKYLMGGFISGIASMAITLVQAGLKPVMAFVNAVRNALLMHSNSKLAEQWGHFVTGGFVDGLDDGTPAVSKAATKMAQGTSSGISSGLRSNSGRGGGNSLQFNFTFNGDVSDERQKELEKKMKTFFNNEIVTLFGEATA